MYGRHGESPLPVNPRLFSGAVSVPEPVAEITRSPRLTTTVCNLAAFRGRRLGFSQVKRGATGNDRQHQDARQEYSLTERMPRQSITLSMVVRIQAARLVLFISEPDAVSFAFTAFWSWDAPLRGGLFLQVFDRPALQGHPVSRRYRQQRAARRLARGVPLLRAPPGRPPPPPPRKPWAAARLPGIPGRTAAWWPTIARHEVPPGGAPGIHRGTCCRTTP